MKCPKCGYNSFEYHDSCIKCSSDLSGYKLTHGITSLVLPLGVREKMAEELRGSSAETGHVEANNETHEDMFALDLPDEPAAPVAQAPGFADDPFNFDDEPPAAPPQQAAAEIDPFADLLETTPQVGDSDPFGAPPAAAKPVVQENSPGEFDLENFSWDDTPDEKAGAGGQGGNDDFDSLFGDSEENSKK